MQINPEPMSSNNEVTGNTATKARLDISTRGLLSTQEKTFFDIRVTHPNADSNMDRALEAIYKANEKQKEKFYNGRILNVEKASFMPLNFMNTGAMSKQ